MLPISHYCPNPSHSVLFQVLSLLALQLVLIPISMYLNRRFPMRTCQKSSLERMRLVWWLVTRRFPCRSGRPASPCPVKPHGDPFVVAFLNRLADRDV